MFMELISNWLVSIVFGYFRPRIKFAKLFPEALKPTRREDGSLGFDLYAPERVELNPGETKVIDTGIAFDFPCYLGMFLWDKSSVAARNGLSVRGGVIDPGYRGPVCIILKNVTSQKVVVAEGSAVAQAVFHMAVHPWVEAVKAEDLSESVRGERGFGGDWEWFNKRTNSRKDDRR